MRVFFSESDSDDAIFLAPQPVDSSMTRTRSTTTTTTKKTTARASTKLVDLVNGAGARGNYFT